MSIGNLNVIDSESFAHELLFLDIHILDDSIEQYLAFFKNDKSKKLDG